MYTLGIDLHKRTSAWVLINHKREELWKKSVPVHPLHFTTAIEQMPVPPKEVQVAIEPVCGWRWVMDLLEDKEFEVHAANPRKLRLIAQNKHKHDRGDAKFLAELLSSGFFPESHKISDRTYRLRSLIRERLHLIKVRTGVKNRIHGLATARGLHKLNNLNPLSASSREQLKDMEPVIFEELLDFLNDLNDRINSYDKLLKEIFDEFPKAKLISTMPGIGRLSALTILSEVDDFSRFRKGDHLASFAGLVPRQRSSGASVRLGSITNEGSRILKTTMVEAAMRVREKNAPELFKFVERVSVSSGRKRARVALARKMLALIFSMVKNNTAYDRDRVSGTADGAKQKRSRNLPV